MNVLEKILEEIKKPTNYTIMCGKHFTTLDRVEEIIRSHMDEVSGMRGKRLIDANALDEEVRNFFLAITGDPSQSTVVRECKESFRRIIDEQPTVYEASDWISVEEEPPEESGYYMACIYNEEVDDYDFRKTWFAHVDDYDMDESEWRELYDFERVIAWQPPCDYSLKIIQFSPL